MDGLFTNRPHIFKLLFPIGRRHLINQPLMMSYRMFPQQLYESIQNMTRFKEGNAADKSQTEQFNYCHQHSVI